MPLSSSLPFSNGVWVNSVRAPFGTSVFDSLVGVSASEFTVQACRHYDRTLISLQEEESSGEQRVNILPGGDIPFGRARHCSALGSVPCPTTVESTRIATFAAHEQSENSHGHCKLSWVQLAVVGMVESPNKNKLLITRRPAYMRSFPESWVFPGGGVDPDDDSLANAVAREILEETGLQTTMNTDHNQHEWTVNCVWESVFPTIPQPHTIRRHHLVVFLSTVESNRHFHDNDKDPALQLCREEVDGGVWLSPTDIESILAESLSLTANGVSGNDNIYRSNISAKDSSSSSSSCFVNLHQADGSIVPEALRQLTGIYPQHSTTATTASFGIAQGSLFALQEFWQRRHPHWTIDGDAS